MNYVAIPVAVTVITLLTFFDYCDRQQHANQITKQYEEEEEEENMYGKEITCQ